jgi:hypothetical protein
VSYGFYRGQRYRSLQFTDGDRFFAKEIVKGPLSFYRSRAGYLIQRKNLIKLPSSDYVKILDEVLADCKLSANETSYTKKDLANLINNYNRCKGYEPEFKRSPRRFAVQYRLFGSYTQNNLEIPDFRPTSLSPSVNLSGGGGVDFSWPRFSNRLFATVDILYDKSKHQGFSEESGSIELVRKDVFINVDVIKIPFGIRLNFLPKQNTIYIKGGLEINRVVSSNFRTLQETEKKYANVVQTKEFYGGYQTKNSVGLWTGIGYDKTIFGSRMMFVEFRYEKNKGFMGEPFKSSSLINYAVLLGVRF